MPLCQNSTAGFACCGAALPGAAESPGWDRAAASNYRQYFKYFSPCANVWLAGRDPRSAARLHWATACRDCKKSGSRAAPARPRLFTSLACQAGEYPVNSYVLSSQGGRDLHITSSWRGPGRGWRWWWLAVVPISRKSTRSDPGPHNCLVRSLTGREEFPVCSGTMFWCVPALVNCVLRCWPGPPARLSGRQQRSRFSLAALSTESSLAVFIQSLSVKLRCVYFAE